MLTCQSVPFSSTKRTWHRDASVSRIVEWLWSLLCLIVNLFCTSQLCLCSSFPSILEEEKRQGLKGKGVGRVVCLCWIFVHLIFFDLELYMELILDVSINVYQYCTGNVHLFIAIVSNAIKQNNRQIWWLNTAVSSIQESKVEETKGESSVYFHS